MSAYKLYSCLAKPIENFIKLRRLSGTDYASQARLLEYFDHFLVKRKLAEPRLSREIIEAYQQSLAGLAPRYRGNRFCVVRQLCEYLARTDPLSYVPEPLRTPPSYAAHTPYIYSRNEIRAMLAAASELPPAGSLRPHTYRTLLGLLYSTGIRIGEALALNIEHFLPAEQRLYIAQGKFRKARWTVLSDSTCRALEHYLGRRLAKTPRSRDASLFLNDRCKRLCHPTVNQTVKSLLNQCGIAGHGRAGPRIHDIRHSFAVHRLLAWYRDGQDVNARLPALATYMGHVHVSSTHLYLRPTAELLGEVHHRFHNHYLENLSSPGEPS